MYGPLAGNYEIAVILYAFNCSTAVFCHRYYHSSAIAFWITVIVFGLFEYSANFGNFNQTVYACSSVIIIAMKRYITVFKTFIETLCPKLGNNELDGIR